MEGPAIVGHGSATGQDHLARRDWVRRATAGKSALFALIDYDAPEAKTMLDWAREVEGWEDMKPVEIMVAMTEAGYQMEVPPNEAVKSLGRALNKISNLG